MNTEYQYTLITRDQCPICDKAKTLLTDKKISYQELKIGIDIDREAVIESYPDRKMLPIVIERDRVIGGYLDLLDVIYPPMKDEQNADLC